MLGIRWVSMVALFVFCVVGEFQASYGTSETAAEQKSTPPTGAVATAQANAPTVMVPQCQVVYETVQSYECVQVPVTHMQTLYRTECRTENVPVTRMIPEVVNETRTVTVCTPKEERINQRVTRIVCEPVQVVKKCYQPVPVTKNVERVIYQTRCTPVIATKQVTRMIPQCVTEMVPVTRMIPVVEPQVCYVTQKVPVTTMVPFVTCSHPCGHQCGGGCGQCGGTTTCVRYRPVTTCYEQQVAVTKQVVRHVPETIKVPRQRTTFTPVQETIQVCEVKTEKIPFTIVQCVTTIDMKPYDVTVTEIRPKPITETIPVTITRMVPEQKTIVVPTVRCRPVTETVTRQVQVCVPYQVPVTTMTTQTRPVAHQVAVTRQVMVPAASLAVAGPQPTPQAGH